MAVVAGGFGSYQEHLGVDNRRKIRALDDRVDALETLTRDLAARVADLAAARQQLDQVREYANLLSRTAQQRPEVIAVDVAWKLRQILDTATARGETS
jgi:hypothetical protein